MLAGSRQFKQPKARKAAGSGSDGEHEVVGGYIVGKNVRGCPRRARVSTARR